MRRLGEMNCDDHWKTMKCASSVRMHRVAEFCQGFHEQIERQPVFSRHSRLRRVQLRRSESPDCCLTVDDATPLIDFIFRSTALWTCCESLPIPITLVALSLNLRTISNCAGRNGTNYFINFPSQIRTYRFLETCRGSNEVLASLTCIFLSFSVLSLSSRLKLGCNVFCPSFCHIFMFLGGFLRTVCVQASLKTEEMKVAIDRYSNKVHQVCSWASTGPIDTSYIEPLIQNNHWLCWPLGLIA